MDQILQILISTVESHLKYKCEIFNYATKESLIYLNLVFELGEGGVQGQGKG